MAPKAAAAEPAVELAALPSYLGLDVESVFDFAKEQLVSEPLKLDDGSSVLFVNSALRAERLPALNPVLPARVTQAETIVEPESFANYVNRFKTETSIARASLKQNSITAILDYHGRSDGIAGAIPQPTKHIVTLNCPWDVDYAIWRAIFDKGMDQKELVTLIEDMLHTIGAPPAADLMEAITDMKVDRVIRFKQGMSQRDGTIRLTYEENDGQAEVGGEVTLPQTITIRCPIFQGAQKVTLDARLRYQIARGSVSFTLKVPGLANIERQAFRDIGDQLVGETGIPIFYVA